MGHGTPEKHALGKCLYINKNGGSAAGEARHCLKECISIRGDDTRNKIGHGAGHSSDEPQGSHCYETIFYRKVLLIAVAAYHKEYPCQDKADHLRQHKEWYHAVLAEPECPANGGNLCHGNYDEHHGYDL